MLAPVATMLFTIFVLFVVPLPMAAGLGPVLTIPLTAAGFPVAGGTLQRSVGPPTGNMALLGPGNSELLQIMRQTTG